MSHQVTRRNFLRMGAAGVAAAALSHCAKPPAPWTVLEPYVRPPEEQYAGVATWYASTCRQCPAGCGIIVRIMNGRALKIEGNPEHPLNQGKLCARGQSGLQLLYSPDRLPGPVAQANRNTRQFEQISWDQALNTLYTRVKDAGSSVVVWGDSTMSTSLADLFQSFTAAVGAPDPLLFDLYSEMTGYAVLRHSTQELFAQPGLPVYNIGLADIVFSFGADLLGASMSQVRYGIEYGQFRSQPLGRRGYLVQFEPRQTITGAKADRWLPIRPGSEALVAQAIARIIADEELGPADRVARAKSMAGSIDVNAASSASDVPAAELARLASIFATAERPLAVPGRAIAGQLNGVEGATAVQVLNLIAGNAGQPGGLSLSPQSPLGSQLEISSYADVQPLIERLRSGEVQVLLVHGANPVFDLPAQAGLVEALGHVPFVVSFAPVVDETAVWADMVLPDLTYLESWGYKVVSPGFDLPVVGSLQPVVDPVFDGRSTGDVLLAIAKGIPAASGALNWPDEAAFVQDTITQQLPPGAFDGSGAEVLWARFRQHGGWWPASAPAAAPLASTLSQPVQATAPSFQGSEQEFPYFLHVYTSDLLSDGRGANLTWLQGSPDPMTTISWQTWVELHPSTAEALGLENGDVVRVTSPYGEIEALVLKYPVIRPDTVGIPLGQGHTDYGRYARDRGSNPMQLIGAQSTETGDSLAWGTVRVKIAPTGRRVALAAFESILGVTEGFVNEAFPS